MTEYFELTDLRPQWLWFCACLKLHSCWINKYSESLGRAVQWWIALGAHTETWGLPWGLCWSVRWQESQRCSWHVCFRKALRGRKPHQQAPVHMEQCCCIAVSPQCQSSCRALLQWSQPGHAVQGIAKVGKGCAAVERPEPSAEKGKQSNENEIEITSCKVKIVASPQICLLENYSYRWAKEKSVLLGNSSKV